MSNGMFYKGVALGAVVSITLLSAQAAFAGTGVGAIFNLGRTNSVNGTTTLTGTTAGSQLQVTNKSTSTSAFGLSITTSTTRPPLKVNSQKVVTNLNSNFLQGKRASDFLAATGTAANASKLGGKPASDYLLSTGTAADAAKLGGIAADQYIHGCPLLPGDAGIVGGPVAAKVVVGRDQPPSSFLSTNGVSGAWTCSGGPIWVQKYDVGQYCIVVDPTVQTEVDGWTYAGLPLSAGSVVPVATGNNVVATASTSLDLCGPGAGVSGQIQYIGFTVRTLSPATGEFADGQFSFALL